MTKRLLVFIALSLVCSFSLFNKAEAATNVYYSVGQNTDDHKTGSPTVTIVNGLATFSVAQTGSTTGVGDRVTFGNSIAYIASKASTDMTQWNLVTATGTMPVATTSASVTSIKHEYTSLANAEAGAGDISHMNTADLVTGDFILNLPCYYDTGPNTTAVTIDGWITDATHYIRIYTPFNTSTEINLTQRHSGKWDDTKFSSRVTGGTVITLNDDFIYLDGLQVQITMSSGSNKFGITSVGTSTVGVVPEMHISNNIIKGVVSGTASQVSGIFHSWAATGSNKSYIWNNIVYDFTNPGYTGMAGIFARGHWTSYMYNNTVYNCEEGYGGDGGIIAIKNNIAYSITKAAWLGSFITASSTSNLSGPAATTTPGTSTRNGMTVTFVDEANDDFHISATDTGTTGYGTDLSTDPDGAVSFTTDIDGQTRSSTWDIGADEYVDITPPTLTEITPISTPSTDTTPSYVFSSTESGTLLYAGSCTLDSTSISSGTNTITFNTLAVGTYTDCMISVLDSWGNNSATTTLSSFTIYRSSGSQRGTITITTLVENDNRGTKTVSDFPLFVNNTQVTSGITTSFPAPANAYTVSVTTDASYTQTFSGDCDTSGHITLSPGDFKTCTVTMNDIAPATSSNSSSASTAPATSTSATPSSSSQPSATATAGEAGLTETQITSILNVLISFGADAETIKNVQAALSQPSPKATAGEAGQVTFSHNLSLHSTGPDVQALQQFLNSHGFTVSTQGPGSTGNETNLFGALTQSALIKFQKANGIVPAVGYFGPITREKISTL